MKKLILASTSPYRFELLKKLALNFECAPSHVDEDHYKDQITDPLELTKRLAFEKAKSVAEKFPDAIVIGGDQVSLFEGEILGKPHTPEGAFKQLSMLQGNTHQLFTATSVLGPALREDWVEVITLKMKPLTSEEIKRYIEKDRPLDCAGSYKIEQLGISLFEEIDCFDQNAIVGLPLIKLSEVLRTQGFSVP
ncbi:MAG: Maf family protein [Bacteriovoracaceae bacterium]|nr:Maf family protein [Bacteriovoracaceae bacterium]